MSKLQIINGQFIRNGQVEKAEFGNLEQIRCIKDTERLLNELRSGLIIEPDYETVITSSILFKCSCNRNVYMEQEVESDTYSNPDWVGKKLTCSSCQQKYIIGTNDDDDLIVMFDNK